LSRTARKPVGFAHGTMLAEVKKGLLHEHLPSGIQIGLQS
jgi:hypothetical protein